MAGSQLSVAECLVILDLAYTGTPLSFEPWILMVDDWWLRLTCPRTFFGCCCALACGQPFVFGINRHSTFLSVVVIGSSFSPPSSLQRLHSRVSLIIPMSVELPSNIPESPSISATTVLTSAPFTILNDESMELDGRPVQLLGGRSSTENKENIPPRWPFATSPNLGGQRKKKGSITCDGGVSKTQPLADAVGKVPELELPNDTALVRVSCLAEAQQQFSPEAAREVFIGNQRAKELTELPLREISEAYGIQIAALDEF